MKVSRIEIKDFQQFKNFELDLTYPEGHPKAGEPLDKVCFIGQSGTGKTTILRTISQLISLSNEINLLGKDEFNETNLTRRLEYQVFGNENKGFVVSYKDLDTEVFYHQSNFDWRKEPFRSLFKKNKLIFFETGLENHDKMLLNPITIQIPAIHTKGDIDLRIHETLEQYQKEITIKSNQHFEDEKFSFLLFYSCYLYDIAIKDKLMELTKTSSVSNFEEFTKWKIANPNPRAIISEKLNPILSKFNLKVDGDFTNNGALKITTLQGKNIEIPWGSTGTRQILLSVIPLFFMETTNKIILFDEPERSLFPDIQRTLINYYTELAPEAQFFFATHSPIIASQFEPCERFILSFDEETGFVKAQNGIAPEGDDPNDLLSKDFGMRNLMGEKGMAAWERFVELRMLIREEKESTKKENLMKEYLTLQSDYNF
jgi:predicted ATPase